MKALKLIAFILATGSFASCTPDLIVNSIQQTGNPTINANNSVELPIRVVVENRGNGSAGTFKVCVEYTRNGQTFVAAFTVPGEGDIWYPHTDGSLAAFGQVTFEGVLVFHPSVHGETVSLKATADSCSGDEFKPDYCRVKESDETNNVSASINVTLP